MKSTIRKGDPVWTHHPRGGITTGFAGERIKGVYGQERRIALTKEAALKGEGFTSVPTSQVYPESTKPQTP